MAGVAGAIPEVRKPSSILNMVMAAGSSRCGNSSQNSIHANECMLTGPMRRSVNHVNVTPGRVLVRQDVTFGANR